MVETLQNQSCTSLRQFYLELGFKYYPPAEWHLECHLERSNYPPTPNLYIPLLTQVTSPSGRLLTEFLGCLITPTRASCWWNSILLTAENLFFLVFIYLLVCVDAHAMALLWRSEDGIWETVLTFHREDMQELDSGHPIWWPVPLPAETSYWPKVSHLGIILYSCLL